MFLRNFIKLKPTNNLSRETTRLFAVTRHYCDGNKGSEVSLHEDKSSDVSVDVKSEEAKIIAKIHEDYKSEVLVKLNTESSVGTNDGEQSSELSEKYEIKFDNRLDHFRRSGFIASPTLINVSDEPSISPIVDTAIQVVRGTTERDLAPTEIFTENSDNRSIDFYPPSYDKVNQKWHQDDPEETTLGFPVVRAPHPMDRVKEGFKISKSGSKSYPYIQDFKDHYDIVIVGGGLVGSFIAHSLTEKLEVSKGCKVAVIEKDPSYRSSLSTTSPMGLKVTHSLPETIEMALYGSDFLRHLQKNFAIPFDEIHDEDYFNIPNIKFQPNGHLTLASPHQMQDLLQAHENQKMAGVQSAIMTAKQIKRKFPWVNIHGIEGGCLGMESEGWFDSWNLLQAVKLKNKHQGVDYIHGEVIYFKKHKVSGGAGTSQLYMGFHHDGSMVDLGRSFEAHLLLPDSKQVYPLHFSNCILAGAGATGDLGRMCGIGDGYGPLAVEIPVEKRRGYVYTVETGSGGPGLNTPLTMDSTGLFLRREGYAGQFSVGLLPDNEVIPVNVHGEVHQDYWDDKVFPMLRDRFDGFQDAVVTGSQALDYDVNYFDGSPIIGPHPYVGNMWIACGFGAYGGCLAPAAGRAITELIYDDGYHSVDLSRLSFDRVLLSKAVNERSSEIFLRKASN